MNRLRPLMIFSVLLIAAVGLSGCSLLPTIGGDDEAAGGDAAVAAPENTVHLRIDFKGKVRTVVIQLDPKAAPQTCANFRKLVASDFYDGIAIHRAIPDYLVQAGDPLTRDPERKSAWGTGGPGYTVPAEIGLDHRRGAVAMARLGDARNPERASNGSQFYICLADIPALDDGYTVFGTVTSGMDVLDEIAALPTDVNDVPRRRVEIVDTALVDAAAPVAQPQPSEKRLNNAPADANAEDKGFLGRFMNHIW